MNKRKWVMRNMNTIMKEYIDNLENFNKEEFLKILNDIDKKQLYNSPIHGLYHSEKVLLFSYLIGKHSYKVFVSGDRDNYNSEIYKIIFKKEKDILTITFEGKSFYRYMVRNMVGALLLVGCGKISIEEFKNMIDSDENKYTYITAPSNGLYLESVEY